MAHCVSCGHNASAGERFCPSCGASAIEPDPRTPSSRPRFTNREGGRVNLWIAAGLVVAAFWAYSHFSDDSSSPARSSESSAELSGSNASDTPSSDQPSSRPAAEPTPDEASARDAIREVMRWDRSSADIIYSRLDALSQGPVDDERLDSLGAFISDYAADARAKSLEGCPTDFREAYYRYVSAWSEAADLMKSHPHMPTEDEVQMELLLRTLRDGNVARAAFDVADPLLKYLDGLQSAFNSVNARKNELGALLIRYGAD